MNDENSNAADLQPKPLKGKYDKRCKSKTRGGRRSNSGPKPYWLKHLHRNSATYVLRTLDELLGRGYKEAGALIALYKRCWDEGELAICAQLMKDILDRRDGKPFVAENPDKANSPNNLAKDERLQNAITELLPAKATAKTVM